MAIGFKAMEVISDLCKNNFGIKFRRNQDLILVDNKEMEATCATDSSFGNLVIREQWLEGCVLDCSVVSSSVVPWTVACQALLYIEFPRQECWNGSPFPTLEDLPYPGTKLTSFVSLALAGRFFTTWEAQLEA